MPESITYRGFDIDELEDGRYVVKKDGEVKEYSRNLEDAYLWVDGEKATEHKRG